MFFSRLAGEVAERRVVDGGPELPQRDLAFLVGIGRGAEQAGVSPHGMFGSVLGVAAHLEGLSLAVQDGSGLSEGGGSGTQKAEKTNSQKCGLHKMVLFPEENAVSLKELAECPVWRGFWGSKGNRHTKWQALGFELAAGFGGHEQDFAHMW